MGATKINIKHVAAINTEDLAVLGFELLRDMACQYTVSEPVTRGEIVLIKASFKDACETDEVEDENVLYRRRVVPFVTRVKQIDQEPQGKRTRVSATIENITDEDRSYFYRKYFESEGRAAEQLKLDLEGKRINFAIAL